MPSRASLAVAVVAVLTLGALAPGATAKTRLQEINADIDSAWNAFRPSQNLVGMCVAVVDVNARDVHCDGTLGPGTRRRATGSTLFELGSVSKVFTATLLALDVQRGRVKLSDPVSEFFPSQDYLTPSSNPLPASLTLRTLAQHYSGLPQTPSEFPIHPVTSVDDVYRDVAECEDGFPLGWQNCPPLSSNQTSFHYSNVAYFLLGDLLADRIDGYPRSRYGADGFGADLATNVLAPLGMVDSGTRDHEISTCASCFSSLRAHGRNRTKSGALYKRQPPPDPNFPAGDPAGGIWSSARDMLRFLEFSMGLDIGSKQLQAARPLLYDTNILRLVATNGPSEREDVGLGWQITTNAVSPGIVARCVHKGGIQLGFNSEVLFRQNLASQGVVVLLNVNPGAARMIALRILSGLPFSHPLPPCLAWPAPISPLL